jgi:dihydrofolate reductase
MEAIYAVDIKNGLAKCGKIPWHSKKDLKFFMDMTKNNIVIMGKNTYLSIPKRPLFNRVNIVLTSNPKDKDLNNEANKYSNLIITDNNKFHDIILNNKEFWINKYSNLNKNFKIFFIGGKQIYEQFIPFCERVWVTTIKKDYSCDLFLEHDFSKQFIEELVDEDEELKIYKYTKFIYK